MVVKIRDKEATAAAGVLLPSESVELNIELVEQSLYHQKYDWKAWLIDV